MRYDDRAGNRSMNNDSTKIDNAGSRSEMKIAFLTFRTKIRQLFEKIRKISHDKNVRFCENVRANLNFCEM
jgi:hypothetical protein